MSQTKFYFEINTIALAVATVIVRHRYSKADNNKQFSAVDLVNEVNSLPFNEIIRIHDIAILQQGLFEFKFILQKSYPQLLLISQQRKGELLTNSFLGLDGHHVAHSMLNLVVFISALKTPQIPVYQNSHLPHVR